jgi:hypothetical protein
MNAIRKMNQESAGDGGKGEVAENNRKQLLSTLLPERLSF